MICPYCNKEFSETVFPLHLQRCFVPESGDSKQEEPKEPAPDKPESGDDKQAKKKNGR